jgi:iron complex outermembrane recepter protein
MTVRMERNQMTGFKAKNQEEARLCSPCPRRQFAAPRGRPGPRLRDLVLMMAAGLLALGAGPDTIAADAAATTDATDTGGIQEVTVTAEKFNSTVQATPISISAVTGAQLQEEGITSVEDLAHELPGLSMRTAGPGETEYEARGLASNGGAAPTVGFYLDDIPLSPPALAQIGKVVIDPDIYDLNRIEVLRGPQGTLYGSSSMGGTVKLVTNQPQLGTFEGSAQGTVSYTDGAAENGGANLMLNVPMGDVLALRVVAGDSFRSGWISRTVLDPFPAENGAARGDVLTAPVASVTPGVDTLSIYGSRASLLFTPSDSFSIVALAMYQRMVMGGYDEFDSPPGSDYPTHYEAFPEREPFNDTVHIYSITGTYHTGFADLTSATSYWYRSEFQSQDASENISVVNDTPYLPSFYSERDLSHQFSQEVRLSSVGDDRLHWTTGAFFSQLRSVWNQDAGSPENDAPNSGTNGTFYYSFNPYQIQQIALFADGSVKIADAFKFETGVRWYRYQSHQIENETGSDGPVDQPPLETRAADSGYNPRFNFSYLPTEDLTTYISASKGFRPGGANQIIPPSNLPPYCTPTAPLSFGPDNVWDYEIGEKSRFFDHRLTINADVFYIQWIGVQQAPLLACGYQYDTNAGDAHSYGPELEINAQIADGWLLSVNGAYTEARLIHPNEQYLTYLTTVATKPNGQLYCLTTAGCTAPILNVAKDSVSVALSYTTTLPGNWTALARVSADYTGSTPDEAYYYDITLPAYTLANARIVLTRGPWSGNLFINNLTNKVAELTANNTAFSFNIPQLTRFSTNQPLTVGAQINFRF